jgi:hypothetical protein
MARAKREPWNSIAGTRLFSMTKVWSYGLSPLRLDATNIRVHDSGQRGGGGETSRKTHALFRVLSTGGRKVQALRNSEDRRFIPAPWPGDETKTLQPVAE